MNTENFSMSINIVWVMICTFLIFFMQAGFAVLETGFGRKKNAGNIMLKNLLTTAIGTIVFSLVGFGIMYGKDASGLVGVSGLFDVTKVGEDGFFSGLPIGVFLFYQSAFCATAATIVSGAIAGRTKLVSYVVACVLITIFVYPIVGHWVWGGGWLQASGFHDFAGSTAVHCVGGWCALIGAKMVGARIGKYTKNGNSKPIPGHNIPLASLGVFILWFCWFGFNCGSTKVLTEGVGDIAVNTTLSAASATLSALAVTKLRYGKPDITMTLNGTLAGLVAITGGCDIVSNEFALLVGVIAGVCSTLAVEFIDKVMKIDDPVGATSVHLVCGMLGTVLTAVFAKSSELEAMGITRGAFLKTQLIGVIVVAFYTAIMAYVVFRVIDKLIGLRVKDKIEIEGLDVHEHGMNAYVD